MDRAVYVGVKPGNRSYLLHQGYVRALEEVGWRTDWLTVKEGAQADLSPYDVLLWNGAVPAVALRRIEHRQVLVAMNGAGEDLSHYASYADRFRVATSSFHYLDEPATNLTRAHFSSRLASPQVYYVLKYGRRFLRFAQPRFFRDIGVRFMHLPFASDPALFHPLGRRHRRLRWIFVGLLMGRRLVPKLVRASRERGWAHQVIAPELRNTVDPLELNSLYNEAALGVNEQHLMTFGRELNQRGFDYGMAGLLQISDMGHLCAPMFGASCWPYAGRFADARDHAYALELVEHAPTCDPEAVHEHFARNHSFLARLAALSVACGVDLTRGRMELAGYRAAVDGWLMYRR